MFTNGGIYKVRVSGSGGGGGGSGITSLIGDITATGPGVATATISPGVITNLEVAVGANIARSKLANGNPNEVVVNDATGVLTSVSQLPIEQGGTGEDNKTSAFDALAPTMSAGDMIVNLGGTNVVLSPGQDGTVLTANSNVSEGVEYTALAVTENLSTSITASDRRIYLVDTSASISIELPFPTANFVFRVKDATGMAETNPIFLSQDNGELIDGLAATKALRTNWGAWTIVCNGTDWFVL